MASLDTKITAYAQAGLAADQIAEHLGKDTSYVSNRLNTIFSRTIDTERATRALNLNIERTETMIAAVWDDATEENRDPELREMSKKDAIDTALKVMDRQAKMMGLNAPEKLTVQSSNFTINVVDPHGNNGHINDDVIDVTPEKADG